MVLSAKAKLNEALSRAYKNNPSLDHYLELRKVHPQAEIEVSLNGGIEHAFKNQKEIEALGIAITDYLGILDGDQQCTSRVCLHLLEEIAQSLELKSAGQTHLARRGKVIPDQMIDWLICCMLEGESWNDTLHLNRDLIVLIRQRLMPGTSIFEQLLSVKEQRTNAALIGGQLIARGNVTSFRKVAKILDVEASTVKRWFESKEEFHRECIRYANWFDDKGELRPLSGK